MIDKTWFNAIPHLFRQYWKEMIVLGIVWSALGAVSATIGGLIALALYGG